MNNIGNGGQIMDVVTGENWCNAISLSSVRKPNCNI